MIVTAVSRLIDGCRIPWPESFASFVIAAVLLAQAGLIGFAATVHSPTLNEPGHLVAGVAEWSFGDRSVYRVNPPMTRMIASLPVMLAGCQTNWSRYSDRLGSRCEFDLGWDFIEANRVRSRWLFILARWACIPISWIGAVVAYRWARDLYGTSAGLIACCLWCFSPNILAHGELVTPDVAAASFGLLAGHLFWKWLRFPSWRRAGWAGVGLGLALLAKLSWVILVAAWPAMWVCWELTTGEHCPSAKRLVRGGQLIAVLAVGMLVVNAGYLYEGAFTRLGQYEFFSESLAGPGRSVSGGNCFRGTLLEGMPIPLPKQYVLGIDTQRADLEDYGFPSYLRGEWRDGGWWYYYLYGLWVKVPHGTQALCLLAVVSLVITSRHTLRDEFVLLFPAVVLFAMVSSELDFNHHFRYVLPSFPPMLVFAGRMGAVFDHHHWSKSPVVQRGCVDLPASQSVGDTTVAVTHAAASRWQTVVVRALRVVVAFALASTCASTLRAYPNTLAYFNELAGGPTRGDRHLLHSSLDWGQDLFLAVQAAEDRLLASEGDGAISVLYSGYYDPSDLLPQTDATEERWNWRQTSELVGSSFVLHVPRMLPTFAIVLREQDGRIHRRCHRLFPDETAEVDPTQICLRGSPCCRVWTVRTSPFPHSFGNDH